MPTNQHTTSLMKEIDKLSTQYPFYGARRIQANLPAGFQPVNLKRVSRLMHLMQVEAIYQKPNLSSTKAPYKIYPYLLRNLLIKNINHVWSTDITYIPMKQGFLYLCAVVDWYSRFILSWELSNTLTFDFCKKTLQTAFANWGKPQIFNTDQGSQFTSNEFINLLLEKEILISMDGKGRALDNIFIERFWRTIKYEHIYLHEYRDGKSLYEGLLSFIQFYNYGRKHQSLSYLTPSQVYLERKSITKNNANSVINLNPINQL